MTKKKLILLDLVELKDTEEDSAPLIKRFKYMFIFVPIFMFWPYVNQRN